MCGRYALNIRAAFVRYQLQQQNMPVDDAPGDDETRETYNFAPGYYGLVYRAETTNQNQHHRQQDAGHNVENPSESEDPANREGKSSKYKLQAMKWGLIPFWTKRNPDYGSLMKTINCRDDSLLDDRGMWTSMKRKKRCLVIAQGFYEWLKKNGGKEKIPHFVKRKDGQLMLFAGLWDSVQYEGSDRQEFTYSIITTDVNKQLSFLHDRMPVILDNGSDAVWLWLDPTRTQWSTELQSLLKPYGGELECYAVSKDVGKVGNNSSAFVVPVDSSENKQNIANFFNAQTMKSSDAEKTEQKTRASPETKKRPAEESEVSTPNKAIKIEAEHPASPRASPAKTPAAAGTKKMRSAVSNGKRPAALDAKAGQGNKKITSFFGTS